MMLRSTVNHLLSGAWRVGALPRPSLTLHALEAAALRAERVAGPIPDDHWREPLARLLDSLAEEADLNPLGQAMAWGQIVRLLRERIRAERLWRRHPEILARPLAAPILILGQMRSGTTRLHRLLACDDRLAHNRFFEIMAPLPRRRRGRFDRRVGSAALTLGALRLLNPTIMRIHPTSPKAAEEEFGLLSFSFYGAQFEAQWRIPGFTRYWQRSDRRPAYRDFRRLLQTLSWARGDPEDRKMVLKLPQFLDDLDVVLKAFPDARIIRLHRDPAAVAGSSASLVWNQMKLQSDNADKGWIGSTWLERTISRERTARQALASRPHFPRIDVEFEDMNGDPLGVMRRIYAFLGVPVTTALEDRMRAYLAGAARSGFRHHAYRLDAFGLDAADVRKRFEAMDRSSL